MALCPTRTPNVCNLICVWLLWHHVSRLRLNQAHLDYQFPVASLSLNLVGGVVWSQQENKKKWHEERMKCGYFFHCQSTETLHYFKMILQLLRSLRKRKINILLYQRSNTHICRKILFIMLLFYTAKREFSLMDWCIKVQNVSIETAMVITKTPHNSDNRDKKLSFRVCQHVIFKINVSHENQN